ncbi:membrane protein insertase YidC [Mangrovimonas sp. AS39]|uniref:membrane protein insertase YidC n=1 Tax=Mangrovimonas futianensis TaxID=2895523 RepID=UPI001E622937|nr:membrane protein insertase YidC [Mangrovimonas futianensis]MCF1191276.1 membrane protein insertase YidC [Mangrovimonas futianensis]MCF1194971.1 membrane protein insertase YidC [Mangrovimonas futianensis]
MEEKKLDINSIIGFVLIFGILLYMFYMQTPTQEELEAKQKQEQVEQQKKQQEQEPKVATSEDFSTASAQDSLKFLELQNKLGAFAYSATLPSAKDEFTQVETELLDLKFSNKGGFLKEVRLKPFVDYDSIPIYLIKENNSSFNVNFGTTDSRILNTKDLYFEPSVTKNGENTVVSMKLKVSATKYLEYRYVLKPNDYMMDFSIQSQGLSQVINGSQEVNLDWSLKGFRNDKSISYENRYTRLTYQHDDGKISKLSPTGSDDESVEDLTWLSYRQHFFSSILISETPFKSVKLTSENMVEDEDVDTLFTKTFGSKIPMALNAGELNENLKLYFGPTDHKVLKNYDYDLEDSIPLGWGIFGWINRYLFIPLFNFLITILPYGGAIIVMTILIKLLMSFVQYKQFLSQAKLKVIKPELDQIREKHKDNKMKIQQETMALQTQVGASPLSGCLPALIQLPVFYALFQFFPSAFDLRQKSFLWAEDLSSYDVVAQLPVKIPFYGEHVSLFPILAAIAIFFYMKMTTGQQTAMSQPQQEGMPDMQKMMKVMIYFSPLLMLVFFNNYASGLSLYYFISNLISIGIMIVIKNYILDEDKIHAQIQVKKAQPKKESKFQRKMKEMMEQAEQQQRNQNRKK